MSRRDAAADPAAAVFRGLRDCGICTVITVPDRMLGRVGHLANEHPDTRLVVCTREDEGLAIAAGTWLAGQLSAVVMEASGIGYSGLILARMLKQRTPALVIASHSGVFAESHDYHAATRIVGEGVLAGVGVPYAVSTSGHILAQRVSQAGRTAASQREPIGLLLSSAVTEDDGA